MTKTSNFLGMYIKKIKIIYNFMHTVNQHRQVIFKPTTSHTIDYFGTETGQNYESLLPG